MLKQWRCNERLEAEAREGMKLREVAKRLNTSTSVVCCLLKYSPKEAGLPPGCKCGCGMPVSWNVRKGTHRVYVHGHNKGRLGKTSHRGMRL